MAIGNYAGTSHVVFRSPMRLLRLMDLYPIVSFERLRSFATTWAAQRLHWLTMPGMILMALLQRMPVLRAVVTSESLRAPGPVGAVIRSAVATASSLGAVHALAGATQWSYSRTPPITATVGVAMTPLAFTVIGAQTPAGSFVVTGLPPGLSVNGANSSGVLNASTGFISGTPTVAGAFTTTILAYEFTNRQGDTFGPTTIVFNVAPGTATAPAFTVQPGSQSVTAGTTVTLVAAASGTPPPSFQWRRNGTNLAQATNASLTLTNVQASDAGDYTVLATNSAGSVVSSVATLTVASPSGSARLTNLSVRTTLGAGDSLIVGVVVNDGPRDILVRAAGPALAAFGLSTAMADPRLELYNGPNMVFANNDWAANLAGTFSSVGAFGFAEGSRDAAFLQSISAAYSIQARGTGPGVVLVEAYDTGAPTTARLVNVSARNRVGTGDDILIAGFNIAGTSAKPLLIRAVGPKLTTFGVSGVLANPRLEVYDSAGAKVTENDDWNASLAATFSAVGAFGLDSGSRDAALVATLPPGSYTAQVRGSDGGTGEALIEIYELP